MIVLDASAAINMVFDTEEGRALQLLMLEGEEAHAPYLYVSEICHVLEKYVRGKVLDAPGAQRICGNALDLIDVFHADDELVIESLSESIRLRHSSYDMGYFVLARRLGATLFTMDKSLQTLSFANGVNCISTVNLSSKL